MNTYPHWVNPATTTHCTAPGCRINPTHTTAALAVAAGEPVPARLAVQYTDLCLWHHAHFARVLVDLVSLWPDLEAARYRPSKGEQNTKVQTSGISDLSQSWNPHVTEVLAELADWIGFVVRTVLRERPLPEPDVQEWTQSDTLYRPDGSKQVIVHQEWSIREHTHGLTTETVPRVALATLVKHHARWLSSYPFLGPALLDDANGFRMAAVRAIDAEPVKRVGIRGATCGELVGESFAGALTCAASMVAILSESQQPSTIVCSAHPKSHRSFTKIEWMEWSR